MDDSSIFDDYDNEGAFDEGYIFDDRKKLIIPEQTAIHIKGYGDKKNLGHQLTKAYKQFGEEAQFSIYIHQILQIRNPLFLTKESLWEYIPAQRVKEDLYKNAKQFVNRLTDIYIYAIRDSGVYVSKNSGSYSKMVYKPGLSERVNKEYITKYKVGQEIIFNYGNAENIKREFQNKNIKAVIKDVHIDRIPGGSRSIWNGVWVKDSYGNKSYRSVDYKLSIEGFRDWLVPEEYIVGLAK